MRAVVLGAAGLLGRHMIDTLGPSALALDRAACDITDAAAVLERTTGAELIVNCAGFTQVDAAEADQKSARRANVLGTENVVRAAIRHGAKVIHVSTDFVFDGTQASPYGEEDVPRPLGAYARSKREGEERALGIGGRLFLVRVQGLYGRGGHSFSSRLRELVLSRRPFRIDGERRVQPTWARLAARQLARIAESDAYGVYHVSCRGETTWAGFARAMAERLGVEPAWQEVPAAALAAPAPRPMNCLLGHRRLTVEGLDVMTDWQSALDGYLAEMAAV